MLALPALRTVGAVFPHTALQSPVPSSGVSRVFKSCLRGEEPSIREDGIDPLRAEPFATSDAVTQRRYHAIRPDRRFRPPQSVGFPTGGVSPLFSRYGTVGILLLHPDLSHPASCLPSLRTVLLPVLSAARDGLGIMKALTPVDLTHTARSLRLLRPAVPTFRPQPRD